MNLIYLVQRFRLTSHWDYVLDGNLYIGMNEEKANKIYNQNKSTNEEPYPRYKVELSKINGDDYD